MTKHFLLAALFCTASTLAMADDLIVFRSGEVIKGQVEEISHKSVKYKKASNPEGPSYTAERRELLSIQYENGTVDLLTEPIESEKESVEDDGNGLKFCPQVAVCLGTQGSSGITGGGGVEFIANFKINDRVKMGPGIGMMGHNYNERIDNREDISTFEVPVFYNLQYMLGSGNVKPYFQGQIGYNFGNIDSYYDSFCDSSAEEDEHMGVFFKIGAGVNFNLKRGALFVDLGYKVHTWTLDSTPTYGELTIGYCFRHH